jgi:hypothetical protein
VGAGVGAVHSEVWGFGSLVVEEEDRVGVDVGRVLGDGMAGEDAGVGSAEAEAEGSVRSVVGMRDEQTEPASVVAEAAAGSVQAGY